MRRKNLLAWTYSGKHDNYSPKWRWKIVIDNNNNEQSNSLSTKKEKKVNYFVNEWNYWSTTHIYAYASVENARVTITAHRCVNTYAYTTANISIIFKHQSKITFHETSRHDHAFYLDTHKHSVTACGWAFLHNHIDFVYGTVNAHIQCMSACYKIH